MADDIFCLKPWELQRHNRGELQLTDKEENILASIKGGL